jgi:hypothetical protein
MCGSPGASSEVCASIEGPDVLSLLPSSGIPFYAPSAGNTLHMGELLIMLSGPGRRW